MHNIQEEDWAEDGWRSHTGIDSDSDYCFESQEKKAVTKELSLEETLRRKLAEQGDEE